MAVAAGERGRPSAVAVCVDTPGVPPGPGVPAGSDMMAVGDMATSEVRFWYVDRYLTLWAKMVDGCGDWDGGWDVYGTGAITALRACCASVAVVLECSFGRWYIRECVWGRRWVY